MTSQTLSIEGNRKVGTTERVANLIVETNFADIPKEAIDIAKDAILDCLGVALAGSIAPVGRIIAEFVREMGGTPIAGVVGGGFKTSSSLAALANGIMGHALDYDDDLPVSTSIGGAVHPTAPVLPAILALGEELKVSGKEALTAYVLGFEVETKVFYGIGWRHYVSGWHATATMGTMGAVAAAAKLLKLDSHQTRMALGIAASEAGGLRQNFGTMTKPFHCGNAAKNGIIAAMLAKKGFTADDSILESQFGFCNVFGGDGQDPGIVEARTTEALASPFMILHGVVLKRYPACLGAHRALDAILWLAQEHDISPEEVDSIECDLMPQVINRLDPKTGLEGKFSMAFCMAIALLDRKAGLEQFTDQKVLQPAAQELIKRVRHVPSVRRDDAQRPPAVVTVRLKDGKVYSHAVEIQKGDPQVPLTKEELFAKYRECAQLVLSSADVERSSELVSNFEDLYDVSTLMDIVTKGRR